MNRNILLVDDDQASAEVLSGAMERRGFSLTWAGSGAAALALLEERDFDAVVTDLCMEGMDGLALCERVIANRPYLPVIVITAFGSLESAIAAIRVGACDFLTKPFEVERLRLTLQRAIEARGLREEVERLRAVGGAPRVFDDMISASEAMERVKDIIVRVAESNAALLITGESGSGKELVARAVHRRSAHASGPFVAINCAAMPESLLESELFGHVKGAFTDARTAHTGLFLKASGGTLFLDEIGELPIGMQPKLLRALQERVVRPIGGDREEPFFARVITASNRDLEVEVKERRFRDDLFYRINVVQIATPPLRVRGDDVLLLAQHFVREITERSGKPVIGISSAVAQRLMHYAWPGNVRELKNCIERAVALTRFDKLVVDDLPEKIRDYRSGPGVVPGVEGTEMPTMDEVERRYVLRVLRQVDGSRTIAAEVLGFDRRTLHRKLEKWGFSSEPSAGAANAQPAATGIGNSRR